MKLCRSRWLLGLMLLASPCRAEGAADVCAGLVPAPRQVRLLSGTVQPDAQWSIVLGPGAEADSTAAAQLQRDMREERGWDWRLGHHVGGAPAVRLLRVPAGTLGIPGDDAEAYTLEVLPGSIELRSVTSAGGYYGVQTLRQLLRSRGGAPLPRMRISDWPALSTRGVSDDISRGQMSTMSDFRRTIEQLGSYKINLYCLYLEDAFHFRTDRRIGEGRARLSASELAGLVAEGRRHHVAVVPIFQLLGHQERLLALASTRRYAESQPRHAGLARAFDATADALAAGSGAGDWTKVVGAGARAVADHLYAQDGEPWSFSAVDPAARAFARRLAAEIAGAARGSWFHIGGDEAFDIGTGTSAAEARRIGPGRVQGRYLAAQASFVRETLGRRPMCYSDVILNAPGAAAELDTGLILVDWHYNAVDTFASVDTLRAAGFRNILTSSGVWNWRTFHPNFDRAFENIAHGADAARSRGLLGSMVASWGDGGAESLRESNWPAYAYLAACTWEDSSPPDSAFPERFAASRWGTRGRDLGRVIRLAGWQPFGELGWGGRLYQRPIDIRARKDDWLVRMRRLRTDMIECEELLDRATVDDPMLACLRHACRRYRFVADRELTLSALAGSGGAGSTRAASELRQLAATGRSLEQEYRRLWTDCNRPQGVEVPLERMRRQTATLDSLASRFAPAPVLSGALPNPGIP